MTPEEYLVFLASTIQTSTLAKEQKDTLLFKLEDGTFTQADLDVVLTNMQEREKILKDMEDYLTEHREKGGNK